METEFPQPSDFDEPPIAVEEEIDIVEDDSDDSDSESRPIYEEIVVEPPPSGIIFSVKGP
jgi:hypothetical protein